MYCNSPLSWIESKRLLVRWQIETVSAPKTCYSACIFWMCQWVLTSGLQVSWLLSPSSLEPAHWVIAPLETTPPSHDLAGTFYHKHTKINKGGLASVTFIHRVCTLSDSASRDNSSFSWFRRYFPPRTRKINKGGLAFAPFLHTCMLSWNFLASLLNKYYFLSFLTINVSIATLCKCLQARLEDVDSNSKWPATCVQPPLEELPAGEF